VVSGRSSANVAAKLQGPSLYRIMGGRAAALASAIPTRSGKRRCRLVWNAILVERYIADPQRDVPGMGMSTPP
jgi:cytochrome c2